MTMITGPQVRERARQIVLTHPAGIRVADINAAILRENPEMHETGDKTKPSGTIRGATWQLHTLFPTEIQKLPDGAGFAPGTTPIPDASVGDMARAKVEATAPPSNPAPKTTRKSRAPLMSDGGAPTPPTDGFGVTLSVAYAHNGIVLACVRGDAGAPTFASAFDGAREKVTLEWGARADKVITLPMLPAFASVKAITDAQSAVIAAIPNYEAFVQYATTAGDLMPDSTLSDALALIGRRGVSFYTFVASGTSEPPIPQGWERWTVDPETIAARTMFMTSIGETEGDVKIHNETLRIAFERATMYDEVASECSIVRAYQCVCAEGSDLAPEQMTPERAAGRYVSMQNELNAMTSQAGDLSIMLTREQRTVRAYQAECASAFTEVVPEMTPVIVGDRIRRVLNEASDIARDRDALRDRLQALESEPANAEESATRIAALTEEIATLKSDHAESTATLKVKHRRVLDDCHAEVEKQRGQVDRMVESSKTLRADLDVANAKVGEAEALRMAVVEFIRGFDGDEIETLVDLARMVGIDMAAATPAETEKPAASKRTKASAPKAPAKSKTESKAKKTSKRNAG